MEKRLRKELEELAEEYDFNLKIIEKRKKARGYACSDYFPNENLCRITVFKFGKMDLEKRRNLLLHEFSHCITTRLLYSIGDKEKIEFCSRNSRYFGSWVIAHEVLNMFFSIFEEICSDLFPAERTGKPPIVIDEADKESMIKVYGELSPKERKDKFISMIGKRMDREKWSIEDFRSDMAFYHSSTLPFYAYEQVRKDDFFKMHLSIFPTEFLNQMTEVSKIIKYGEGKWVERLEKSKPFLKKETYMIFKWMLRKRTIKAEDMDEAIKKLYARVVPEKKNKIIGLARKGFEEHLKSFYKKR